MKTSFDWVRRYAFRALDAANAAAGIDEDSAYAVAWLEACGLPGLTLLADALDSSSPDDRAEGLAPDADGHIEAGGRSCLFFAPTVIDYLLALEGQHRTAEQPLVLENAAHPIALVASAARYCPDGSSITVRWYDNDGREIEAHANSNGAGFEDGVPSLEGPAERIELTIAPAGDFVDTSTLADRFATSLRDGIELDEEAFARVAAYSVGVLVPESEESRVHGAGAGLLDND